MNKMFALLQLKYNTYFNQIHFISSLEKKSQNHDFDIEEVLLVLFLSFCSY